MAGWGSPKEHIEDIRRTKFSIGGAPNPLTEDLHQAVRNLSAELYTKDVHFLMEIIQNAEDNQYSTSVKPSLEFILTSRDVTATGASTTLIVFNNEIGFSSKNIDSICSVGRSTKKNNRKQGYIGEKGIGFKSVFLITSQPYIFSNGYQIRFNEDPCPHCGVGFVVPEWVEQSSIISNIKEIYGRHSVLPTTTIVLPLKADKIKAVKQQLSSIHPEVLLFLSKIKQLSVREVNEDPKSNTVNAISISSETNFVTRKNIDAQSYTLHLSTEENDNSQCSYYMWKQKFPVKPENMVERRMGVEELVITLAFPNGERLGVKSPGVYAFLPTEMVTNFPFIIQADFVLSSSRETILLDNKWNQGILDCVPSAFVNAFVSLVKTTSEAPLSSLAPMFHFLPIISSSYDKLNVVMDLIKQNLVDQNILPSHSFLKNQQRFFHKPREVGRIMPPFWNILMNSHNQGVSLLNLSSHGKHILSSSLDTKEYDGVLSFLGVKPVDDEWYAKCLQGTSIVKGVSDDDYLELLQFVADNWSSRFHGSSMKSVPLIRYVGVNGNVSLCSINESALMGGIKVHLARPDHLSWVSKSNKEFRFVSNCFFMPESTNKSIRVYPKKDMLLQWLREQAKVDIISVSKFAKLLVASLGNNNNPQLLITYVHFLYHSSSKDLLTNREIQSLCSDMPVVDKYGVVIKNRQGLLIPADGSKWAELLDSNPWKNNGYVELGAAYICPVYFAGESMTRKQLIDFLMTHVGASDIPSITPPNTEISVVSSPLTVQNALLLLKWIRNLKASPVAIPSKFLECIKKGSWLRTTLNGSSGYRPPSQSFDLSKSRASIFQNGSVLVDIPLIDHGFYGNALIDYSVELKAIGVMFDYDEVVKFIGNHLMSVATYSSLTRGNVFSMLNFIRFLKNQGPVESFTASIREGSWLKTRGGYTSPVGSVLYTKEWTTASLLSNIPFIDNDYYGDEILSFRDELKLLGVVVDFREVSQIVVHNLKPPSQLTCLGAEAFLLILDSMLVESKSAGVLVNTFKSVKCLKTNLGYKSPGECYLSDPSWGCILQVFTCFPVVDCGFYGSRILSYERQLKKMGVVVDFEVAVKAVSQVFSQRATANSITKESAISFLSSYKQLKKTTLKFPSDLKKCIHELKWLRTRLGDHRSPKDCILYGPTWKSISAIALLPFIDDSKNYYGDHIHEYKKELKNMGVITDFKDGAHMVAAGLYLPEDPIQITSENVLSLLNCIRTLTEKNYSFPEDFSGKVSRKWLKTSYGYRSPKESLLFIPEWGSYLKPSDGPFIDKDFYEFDINSYKKELKEIGVIVDLDSGRKLVASFLDFHSEFSTIAQMYTYLGEFNWEPDTEAAKRIWVPVGDSNGQWINPEKCVLFDKEDLFGLQLTVLERYYKQDLLKFFSKAFKVRSNPSIEDYCKLWKIWESSQDGLSHAKCLTFWKYVTKHFNPKTERAFTDAIAKVPAISGSDGVLLFDKRDVFIADDLQLKDLFEEMSPLPIFVWYPQPSSLSLPRTSLLEVYKKIGVRNISESVQRVEAAIVDGVGLKHVNPNDIWVGKGLMRLILGFLSDPSKKIEEVKRHEIVRCLLNLSVLETVEPVRINYSLSLTSGEVINANATQLIRWERESSKFFTQKRVMSSGHKEMVEYATYFSQVISEGVIWEYSDYISALSELIKLAFVLNFDDGAVNFIMKSKNLETLKEDEDFISSAFSEQSKVVAARTEKKKYTVRGKEEIQTVLCSLGFISS